jgi:hypothetical protein
VQISLDLSVKIRYKGIFLTTLTYWFFSSEAKAVLTVIENVQLFTATSVIVKCSNTTNEPGHTPGIAYIHYELIG